MCESDCKCEQPLDLSTAEVGDVLRCYLTGDVTVKSAMAGTDYPITIRGLSSIDLRRFASDGKMYCDHKNPSILGWVDSSGNLCRTRPEPVIDWENVPMDAPVLVNGQPMHYAGGDSMFIDGEPLFWMDGTTSFTAEFQCNRTAFKNATYKIINTEVK
jgi:hypothetical protein